MQLHKVAAMMVAAWILSGCGFTPKRPPLPVDDQRTPVNLVAPYPRPFPPKTSTVASGPAIPVPIPVQQPTAVAVETVATPPQVADPSTSPAEPVPIGEHRPAVAMWPVFLKFEPAITFADTAAQFADAAVNYSWPSVQREPDQNPEHATYPKVEAATAFEVDVAGIKEVDAMVAPEVVNATKDLDTGSDERLTKFIPLHNRRLSTLLQFLPSEPGLSGNLSLRERLERWCQGQENGWLFDNPTDELDLGTHSLSLLVFSGSEDMAEIADEAISEAGTEPQDWVPVYCEKIRQLERASNARHMEKVQ